MKMRSPRRYGFTVVEVIVTLAIMSIALATVVMTTRGRLVESEANALVAALENYRAAIVNFRAHVGGWPSSTRQLVGAPDSPTPSDGDVNDDDICEVGFSAAEIAAWRGPYLSQLVQPQGARVGNSTINNRFFRVPGGTSVAGDLVIAVSEVDEDVATLVDEALDGKPAAFGGGAVQYVPATDSLTYRMRIGGC